MRLFTRNLVSASAIVAMAILALGFQPQNARADEPKDQKQSGKPTDPAKENEEVKAFLKSKGWKLYQDWRRTDFKQMTFLVVQNPDKPFEEITITDDDYKMIAKSTTVQHLVLTSVKTTDAGLKIVATMPHLESIDVGGDKVTDEGIKALAGCKSLDTVFLLALKDVTDEGVKELAALPKLQRLYLSHMSIDGSAFEAFAGNKTLTTLWLNYLDNFTNEGAKHVAKIPNLDELEIRKSLRQSKLRSAGIKAIVDTRLPAKFEFDKTLLDDDLFIALVKKGWLYGPSPPGSDNKKPKTAAEVTFLALEYSNVTDKGFAAVLNCTNTQFLNLTDSKVTDETFKKLTAFKKLNYLTLEGTGITYEGLDAITDLPIKQITMQFAELTEDEFKSFGKFKTLESLRLSYAKLKPAWLKHISTLPNLKYLDLSKTSFDDGAAKYIATMPNLESISLNSTKLGDTGFLELLKAPKLQSIYFDGTNVTKDVLLQAKKDHPKKKLEGQPYGK